MTQLKAESQRSRCLELNGLHFLSAAFQIPNFLIIHEDHSKNLTWREAGFKKIIEKWIADPAFYSVSRTRANQLHTESFFFDVSTTIKDQLHKIKVLPIASIDTVRKVNTVCQEIMTIWLQTSEFSTLELHAKQYQNYKWDRLTLLPACDSAEIENNIVWSFVESLKRVDHLWTIYNDVVATNFKNFN